MLEHLRYYNLLSQNRVTANAWIYRMKGFGYMALSKYDSAQLLFDESISWFQKLNPPSEKEIAMEYFGKGMTYLYQGNYEKAIANNYKALAIFERIQDSDLMFRLRSQISLDLEHLNNYKEALDMVIPCVEYYKRHHNNWMLADGYADVAEILYHLHSYSMALAYATDAVNIAKEINEQRIINKANRALGLVYIGLGRRDEALAIFRNNLKVNLLNSDLKQELKDLLNISIVLSETDSRAAKAILQNVLIEAKQRGELYIASSTYKQLSTIYKTEKNLDSAFYCYIKYTAYKDSIFDKEKTQTIYDLNIKYQTAEKNARIFRLQSDEKLEHEKNALYLTAILLIVLTAIFFILFLISKNRTAQLLVEHVQLKLEANKKELDQFTTSILHKNKIIEGLENKLVNNVGIATPSEINSKYLSELYQLKILTTDDWRQFKVLVEKVYPGLIHKLRTLYPDLTPAEERQFLLVKLKIGTKESADMLGISTDSILKNRYRLKKRFQLQEQNDLNEFVWNF